MAEKTMAIYSEVKVKRHTKIEGDNIHYSFEQVEVLRTNIKAQIKPMEMFNDGHCKYVANEVFSIYLTEGETPAKYNYAHVVTRLERPKHL